MGPSIARPKAIVYSADTMTLESIHNIKDYTLLPRFAFISSLLLTGILLAGCSSTAQQAPDVPVNTVTGSWRVQHINQQPVADYAPVTLNLSGTGQVSGSTGCNQFSGAGNLNDGMATVGKLSITRKNCLSALATQEQQFLLALEHAYSYYQPDASSLVLADREQQPVLRLTGSNAMPEQPATDLTRYFCQGAGIVTVRNVGPQVIEIQVGEKQTLLSQTRSASGSKYVGKDVVFFSKAKEALLQIEGANHGCQKQ